MIYTLDLDLKSLQRRELKQYDNEILSVEVCKSGQPFNLTGYTAELRTCNENKQVVIQTDGITVSNNLLTIDLNENVTRVSGKTRCEIKLSKNNRDKHTFTFELVVNRSVLEEGEITPSVSIDLIEVLDNKIKEANLVKQQTKELIENGGAASKGEINDIYINVKTPPLPFNSLKGDGVTNDTIALKGIIEYIKNKPYKTLYFPLGTYLLDSNIEYTGQYNILGEDIKGSVLKCVKVGTDFIYTPNSNTDTGRLRISNICIDGNNLVDNVINHRSGKGLKIIGNYIKNGKVSIINIKDSFNTWETEIKDNYIEGTEFVNGFANRPNYCIKDNGMTDSIIKNNIITSFKISGIYLKGSANEISSNHIYGYPFEFQGNYSIQCEGQGNIVSHNYCDSPLISGITVKGIRNQIIDNKMLQDSFSPNANLSMVTIDRQASYKDIIVRGNVASVQTTINDLLVFENKTTSIKFTPNSYVIEDNICNDCKNIYTTKGKTSYKSKTNGATLNSFSKIAKITLNKRYDEITSSFKVTALGKGVITFAEIIVNCQQQSTLGEEPLVLLKSVKLNNLTDSNLIGVVTYKGVDKTEIEIYFKHTQSYTPIAITTLTTTLNSSCEDIIFYNEEDLIATLPVGTQINCSTL